MRAEIENSGELLNIQHRAMAALLNPDGSVREREAVRPWPAQVVAVDGGWVYLDDGTVWAAGNLGWYEVMPPLPGTAMQRQREAAG